MLPKLHQGQRRILSRRERFNVAMCGRRFGKTKLAEDIVVNAALDGKPAGWFCPTYKYLLDPWADFLVTLGPVIEKQNRRDHRIKLHTGGTIDAWTMDGEDPGRGRKYAVVVIDEAGFVRNLRDKWQKAIRPTLTDMRGDAWFFGTPKGRETDFAAMFEEAERRDGWAAVRMPTSENPHIPAEEIDAARAGLPEIVFRQEYLAELVDYEGALMKREYIQVVDAAPVGLRVLMGVDLAISKKETADYTAIATVGVAKGGEIYVLDVWHDRWGFYETKRAIQSAAKRYKPEIITIEQTQYQTAIIEDLLRNTSLPVRGARPDKDKVTRFMPVLARYETGLVYHLKRVPMEFETELLSFPIGEHDDQVDALVYAVAPIIKPERKALAIEI